MRPISSASNPRFKAALKLWSARGRQRQGRILIHGLREIHRALDSTVELVELFVGPKQQASTDRMRIAEEAKRQNVPVFQLTKPLLDKLEYGERVEGMVAIATRPSSELKQVALPASPLVGVVQSVEKPGNLGAILRTADGAGVDLVIVADPRCDPFHPNAIRASLGTLFTTPLACADSSTVLEWLVANNVRIVATRVDSSTSFTDVDYNGAVAIVFGNEAEGLSEVWQETGIAPVHIPMRGKADSLNLSAAAAVLFYEARRQRDRSATCSSS